MTFFQTLTKSKKRSETQQFMDVDTKQQAVYTIAMPVGMDKTQTVPPSVLTSANRQDKKGSKISRRRKVSFFNEAFKIGPDSSERPKMEAITEAGEQEADDPESHAPRKFHSVLVNKFGSKCYDVPGIIDAKYISHVYNESVLVTDILSNRVIFYEKSGKPVRSFIMKECSEPWGAIMTPDGHVAVTLRRKRCVALWTNDGETMDIFGEDLLQSPTGIVADKTGRIFVADEKLNDVFVFDQSGGNCLFKLSEVSDVQFNQPRYLCCSHEGRIIVSDSGNHCVKVFDRNGEFLFKFGSYGSGNGQFKFPYGVCSDQSGNILVADHYNNRIVLFTAEGCFEQNVLTSSSGLRHPSGLSIRCAHDRKLYITHGGLRSCEVMVYTLSPVDSELSINVKQIV